MGLIQKGCIEIPISVLMLVDFKFQDMLRKWRRYERKKRHGIFIRGPVEEEILLKTDRNNQRGSKSSVKLSKS